MRVIGSSSESQAGEYTQENLHEKTKPWMWLTSLAAWVICFFYFAVRLQLGKGGYYGVACCIVSNLCISISFFLFLVCYLG